MPEPSREAAIATGSSRGIGAAVAAEAERQFQWPLGRRPDDHPGLGDFGF